MVRQDQKAVEKPMRRFLELRFRVVGLRFRAWSQGTYILTTTIETMQRTWRMQTGARKKLEELQEVTVVRNHDCFPHFRVTLVSKPYYLASAHVTLRRKPYSLPQAHVLIA